MNKLTNPIVNIHKFICIILFIIHLRHIILIKTKLYIIFKNLMNILYLRLNYTFVKLKVDII